MPLSRCQSATPTPPRWRAIVDTIVGLVHQLGLLLGIFYPAYLFWHAHLMWRLMLKPATLYDEPPKPSTTPPHPDDRIGRSVDVFNYDCGPRQVGLTQSASRS